MSSWPPIEEPELLARLALDDRGFREMVSEIAGAVPAREYLAAELAHAVGYPWARPPGSYELRDGAARLLSALPEEERGRLIERYREGSGRVPLLAIGSNAAPEVLERKFAHFERSEDRALLALAGWLRNFDVGPAATVAIYGSMPATIFPSPGTEVAATVLWVTAAQFTQLTWSEVTYWLGRLHTRFEVEGEEAAFDDVLVYVSRFGCFCPEGEPVALAAVPARGRTAPALTQEELLGVAAALALGPGASAEDLVRACCEDMGGLATRLAETVWRQTRPFASPGWTTYAARELRDNGAMEGSEAPERLNEAGFADFSGRLEQGPVTMLNLLAFEPDGGRERYAEYGAAVLPLLEGVGGRVVFQGAAAPAMIGEDSWDLVLLVEYPTRGAFLAMIQSPEYQAIAHLRTEALSRGELHPLDR